LSTFSPTLPRSGYVGEKKRVDCEVPQSGCVNPKCISHPNRFDVSLEGGEAHLENRISDDVLV
jgi:hypothetical protein